MLLVSDSNRAAFGWRELENRGLYLATRPAVVVYLLTRRTEFTCRRIMVMLYAQVLMLTSR